MPLNTLVLQAHLNNHLTKRRALNTALDTAQSIRRRSSLNPEDILPTPSTTKSFLSNAITALTYHLKTLYLFTKSDLKSLLLPCLIFASVTACAPSALSLPTPPKDPYPAPFTRMLLRTALWIFMLLLPFDIDNQRLPTSLIQDAKNKPWRPLPANRLSPAQATDLMWTTMTLSFATVMALGGAWQALGIAAVTYAYNHLRFADRGAFIRTAINVPGFLLFFHGASEVALGAPMPFTPRIGAWYAIVGAIVFTTVHVLDMADQQGDKASGRWTVPLSIGDGVARWVLAAGMLAWSCIVPHFFGAGWLVRGCMLALGACVAGRTLGMRSERADKRTITVWQVWTVGVYLMPLVCA